MQSRRRLLAAAGGTVVASLAGCTDLLSDGPITFEADQATVPESARSELSYEEVEITDVVIEETVEAGDRSRDVEVTNWKAEYDKGIDLPTGTRVRGAVCVVLSTPKAEVLGRTFNPIADMDPEEIMQEFQGRIEGIEDVERVGEESASMLGSTAEVGRFEAQGAISDGGPQVDVELLVTEGIESEDDLVLAVAAYPLVLAEQERPDGLGMIEGIDHPT